MKEYKITHREELIDYFYVEANSEDEALDEFYRKIDNGEIDFGDMEMVGSEDTAELVDCGWTPAHTGFRRRCRQCEELNWEPDIPKEHTYCRFCGAKMEMPSKSSILSDE